MAHAGTGHTAGELSEAFQVITMGLRHGVARRNEERPAKEVVVGSNMLYAKGAAAVGRGSASSKDRGKEEVRQAEHGAA